MSLTCCKTSSIAWFVGGVLALGGGSLAALHYLGVFRPDETPVLARDAGTLSERSGRDCRLPCASRTSREPPAFASCITTAPPTRNCCLRRWVRGVAVLDFDNDGKPDLLFLNGCPWPAAGDSGAEKPTLELCHNEGGGRFKDVTKEAGLAVTMFGMGATVGDYDNDGWPDLFVTGIGGNRLFHNQADHNGVHGRHFVEVTASAGVGGPGGWPDKLAADFFAWDRPICFSTSASFLDYDGDGKLDLFVCNYVRWSPAYDLSIGSKLDGKERTYGQPKQFDGALCFLYRNEGGGKFTDVSKESGVQVFEQLGVDANSLRRPLGKSLGVIVCDADEDGWPDIVVANDSVRNFFFHNQPGPNGTRVFKEGGQCRRHRLRPGAGARRHGRRLGALLSSRLQRPAHRQLRG